MKLIHQSPLGALEIPTVLGVVEPGAPFDIEDDLGVSLLSQSGVYSLAPGQKYDSLTADMLADLAARRVVELDEKPTKSKIIAALKAADAEEAGK